MTYEKSLDALSDANRRSLLEDLAKGPKSVGELAAGLNISRPAVSQHLKALKQANLASDRASGTQRIYKINPEGLQALRLWLDDFWTKAMQTLAEDAEDDDQC